MQKLIYPLWKDISLNADAFRQQLIEQLGPKIIAQGSLALRICVADSDVSGADPYRISSDNDPIDAIITVWLDTYLNRSNIEASIASHVDRYSGYAVWESEPLVVPEQYRVAAGQRSPGMNEVVFLRKPDRLSREAWLDIWHNSHTQVAIDTQSTFGYRQNVVVKTLTDNASWHDAIIEENFPEAAIHSRMAFYDAGSDEALYRSREQAMIDSCTRFIDFDNMDCIPMSEYILQH